MLQSKIGTSFTEINQIKMKNQKKDKDSLESNKETQRDLNESTKNIEKLFNE